MHVDHHPLIAEFPEFKDAIHDLKMSDAHFTHLFTDYESVDKAIVRAENGIDTLTDLELGVLKKQRLSLRDKLYAMLHASRVSA